MNHSLLMSETRLQLINQLVYLDDEKTHFLDIYIPEHNQKRMAIDQLLSIYASNLERIIADYTEESLNSMALIGSCLELRYLDDDSIESFTIVFPHNADPNQNLVSFLSPLGFQLLMARSMETYKLDVPSGEISIKVEGIKFVNRGNVN